MKAHYSPGLVFRLRLDDASAPHLFFDNMEQARANAVYYCERFEAMVDILELDPLGLVVQTIRESSLVSEEKFNQDADYIVPVMEAYLNFKGDIHARERLAEMGWRGPISAETCNFYMNQYKKLYPMDTFEKSIHRLARYLSGSLARKRLNVDASDPAWLGQYIELAFFTSPPGVVSRFGRRVYYRTLPCSLTSNHMAPWRAKGYMLIEGDDDAVPKLASFNEPQDYNPNTVTLINGEKSVIVQADYVLAT